MKILYMITRLNVGGATRHVVWVHAGARSAGHDCHLVAGTVPPGEGDMEYFAVEHGIEPQYIPEMSRSLSPKDVVVIWKLYRLLLRLRPDIVDTHMTKAGTVGRVAGLLYRWLTPGALIGMPRRCRFVHTYHGHVYTNYFGPAKTRLFLYIEKILARVASDRIIVVSPLQYQQVHEIHGVGRAAQYAIIGYGINTTSFVDWPKRRHVLREEVGAADSEILVGLVGRLATIKNCSMFLQAAAKYKEKYGGQARRRVRFLLIGDGHLRRDLEEETRALGLSDDVIFTGQRDDPENFYPGLDIVAISSLAEGMSLTLLEAMANERAVISTAVGGMPDLLGKPVEVIVGQDGAYQVCEHGVLTECGDVDGFCAGLARLIADEELRRESSARGYRYVQQNYSRERLTRNILNLYRQLLPEKKAGTAQHSEDAAI
ncbi:MAG: glycosyltransferase [Pyrinomonadaceae bacterium]